MPDVKNDRRIRKTKKLLIKSLTTLLKEKKINKITVTELTELADVNRSTFYLYYKDIYDMVEQIENEMFEEFTQALSYLNYAGDKRENLLNFFIFIFEFIKKNQDICKILLGPDGDYPFLNRFKEVIFQFQPPVMETLSTPVSKYWMPFAISGCIGAIQQWLEDDMSVQPAEIADFIIEVMANGVNYYSKKNANLELI